eukprot:2201540-Ditylum_brightwellii.AAC.1
MEMLKKVWEGKDEKYSSDEKKATTLSNADTLELCQLMADVKFKVDTVYLDVHASLKVFKDTFMSDPNCSPQDLQDIADA